MKIIHLNHGKKVKVDDEDYPNLIVYKWRYNTTGYATRTSRSISMSREIMGAKKGEYVDHINRDKLDNRRKNLRIVTNQQNCWNTGNLKNLKSKGVSKTPEGKWRAYINLKGKQLFLGSFTLKTDAMKAYDKIAIKTRGKYAITNELLGFYQLGKSEV